jgi:S-(hydroxymethyl)mycothiol dehydrogenase
VSETIGIDDVEDAFAAMGRGDVLRSVVLFDAAPAPVGAGA